MKHIRNSVYLRVPKSRLGKGSVEEITYAPDGSLLAVGSNIGIWLYDTKTSQELAFFAGQMDWGQ